MKTWKLLSNHAIAQMGNVLLMCCTQQQHHTLDIDILLLKTQLPHVVA
jgi:hypothetical protein